MGESIGRLAGFLEENDARSKVATLRKWLGTDPETGKSRITEGQPGRLKTGIPPHRYRMTDVLVDAHLFLRLRARAAARGADGLDDLAAALRLVHGTPFTLPEPSDRWLWASLGEHLDAKLTAAITDTAHLVITRAVVEGDLPLAHDAHRAALAADPNSQILAADRMLLDKVDDHPEKARQLAAQLYAIVDDETGPDDPTAWAQEIMRGLGIVGGGYGAR
jgi:hypothetical protein